MPSISYPQVSTAISTEVSTSVSTSVLEPVLSTQVSTEVSIEVPLLTREQVDALIKELEQMDDSSPEFKQKQQVLRANSSVLRKPRLARATSASLVTLSSDRTNLTYEPVDFLANVWSSNDFYWTSQPKHEIVMDPNDLDRVVVNGILFRMETNRINVRHAKSSLEHPMWHNNYGFAFEAPPRLTLASYFEVYNGLSESYQWKFCSLKVERGFIKIARFELWIQSDGELSTYTKAFALLVRFVQRRSYSEIEFQPRWYNSFEGEGELVTYNSPYEQIKDILTHGVYIHENANNYSTSSQSVSMDFTDGNSSLIFRNMHARFGQIPMQPPVILN